jgi:hypothetical protein
MPYWECELRSLLCLRECMFLHLSLWRGWGVGMLSVSFTVKLYVALRQIESPPHSSLRACWIYRPTCSENTAGFSTPFVSSMNAPIVYTFHVGNYICSRLKLLTFFQGTQTTVGSITLSFYLLRSLLYDFCMRCG